MTLTLTPELSQRLQQEAARHGLDADAYAVSLLRDALPNAEPTLEERLAALHALGRVVDPSTPLLSDEALRRENMYED